MHMSDMLRNISICLLGAILVFTAVTTHMNRGVIPDMDCVDGCDGPFLQRKFNVYAVFGAQKCIFGTLTSQGIYDKYFEQLIFGVASNGVCMVISRISLFIFTFASWLLCVAASCGEETET